MTDILWRIAEVCHELNRLWCGENGDHSQIVWAAAPQWQKDAAYDGVVYALDHPAATPADVHNQWMMKKVADGWTRGAIKDAVAKTHPCLVPYDLLSLEQRFKDALFLTTAHAVSKAFS